MSPRRKISRRAGHSSSTVVYRGGLALTFALREEDLLSQRWVKAGIKPVQRGKLLRGVGPAGLVGGRCWQGWRSWQWQYVRLWQQDKSKGSLEREEGLVRLLLPGLLCVHIHQLHLPGQLVLPGKDMYWGWLVMFDAFLSQDLTELT